MGIQCTYCVKKKNRKYVIVLLTSCNAFRETKLFWFLYRKSDFRLNTTRISELTTKPHTVYNIPGIIWAFWNLTRIVQAVSAIGMFAKSDSRPSIKCLSTIPLNTTAVAIREKLRNRAKPKPVGALIASPTGRLSTRRIKLLSIFVVSAGITVYTCNKSFPRGVATDENTNTAFPARGFPWLFRVWSGFGIKFTFEILANHCLTAYVGNCSFFVSLSEPLEHPVPMINNYVRSNVVHV